MYVQYMVAFKVNDLVWTNSSSSYDQNPHGLSDRHAFEQCGPLRLLKRTTWFLGSKKLAIPGLDGGFFRHPTIGPKDASDITVYNTTNIGIRQWYSVDEAS